MITDNFCCYLQNKLIQTSVTGGLRYSETSPFSIPWLVPWSRHATTLSITTLSTSVTRFGQIFAIWATLGYFLLNHFLPRQAVSTHGLYKVFQGL
jgi:hypothetical protein